MRKGGRKTLTAAAANRRFARKRLDWLNVFNAGCTMVQVEPADECPNAFQIPLIEQNFIEAHNSDSLLVKRLLGDLYLTLAGFVDLDGILLQANMMRIALKRWEMPGGAQNPPIYNPMLGDDIQLDPGGDDQGDFSEMRAIHEWSHWYEQTTSIAEGFLKVPVVIPHFTSNLSANASLVGPEVAAGTGGGILVDGVPDAEFGLGGEIICDPECEDPEPTNIITSSAPNCWRLHIDLKFRKGIRLHENQALTLFGGWENLNISGLPGRQPQQQLFMAGGLRCLIET